MEDLINDDEQAPEVIPEDKPARSDNRFTQLSEKVKTTAEERDIAKAEAEQAKKDAEFYKGFNAIASKYPGASDFQDKIKEKTDTGYDLEDATVSVLAKAGKFSAPQVQRSSPAGGSATTSSRSPDDKPTGEMTTAEKREKLLEFERTQPGELKQTLRKLNL